MGFAEWRACVAAGLDLWRWESGIYSTQFKEKVIAFVELDNMVKLHSDEAASDKAKSASRKGKG